ncbi:ubiquinone biosynthesis protein [Lentzea xinjiangensis]|uniref:Ubiquinone biosynthesis protein n=2 Tax=Lentzea xinjiangensis TaxID=402600 RepID=A0A1H9WRY3_9PSEU|nr:ubiquinone biosynthesis protein [Lentzea xinjiangensis]
MSRGRAHVLAGALARLLVGEVGRATTADSGAVRQRQRARAVRETLEGLGPFYVKIGQILSTRPDFVSQATIDELGALHDRVGAAPFTVFEPVLEAELGRGWRRWIRDIDVEHPIGSASLAQVYRVRLADGRSAALKVQRPGIASIVHADMAVLRRAGRLLATARPQFDEVVDIAAVLEVIFEAMAGELDFGVEARNMELGARMAEGFDLLTVPEVLLATPRILVQGMAPGSSIRDIGKASLGADQRLAVAHDLLAYMYHCYFVGRTFHADPHPGNVFVHSDGHASLIDWGMIGRVDRSISLKLALTLSNMAQNDGEGAAAAWVEMGKATLRADIEGFTSDVVSLVPRVAAASLDELNFGITFTTLLRYATRRGIRTHPMIPILGKSFANMEGSIRCLAPELSAAQVLRTELTGILMDLTCEMLSENYLARGALELMLASDSSFTQARGVLRDMAKRETRFTTDSQGAKKAGSGLVKYALGALGGLGLSRWWLRHRDDTKHR